MQSAEINKKGYLEEYFHFFHLKDTAGQELDFHFHEFDKIVVLVSGKVDYTVENEVFTLHPWDVLLVRHHAIHKAEIDLSEPYERIIIYLDEKHYASVLPEAELTSCFITADNTGRCLLAPDEGKKQELRETLERFEKYIPLPGTAGTAMRDTVIMQLLIVINGIAADTPGRQSGSGNDKIKTAMSYINENLREELSVDELAEKVFLSKYHFMRLFKETTGMTVHAYVRQRRLMNASRLIREGMPAARAAAESGFDDYSSFFRAFRANFGANPGELKKSQANIQK